MLHLILPPIPTHQKLNLKIAKSAHILLNIFGQETHFKIASSILNPQTKNKTFFNLNSKYYPKRA
jgi:hypothetical protein